MRQWFLTAFAAASVLAATDAVAGVYLTGSVSTQTTNQAFQEAGSNYMSASLDIDLGRYVRLGYTYGLEKQQSQGYKDPNVDLAQGMPADYCSVAANCGNTFNNTTVVENSIGLTLILYEGQTLMPFLLGGGIIKTMTVDQQDYNIHGQLEETKTTTTEPPEPYVGAGIGIRLSKDFTLKLSYQVSPSVTQLPGQKPTKTLDTRSTVGLTYQL